jgi:colanic acid/amylovoran biosynthesis glycosyltransferase
MKIGIFCGEIPPPVFIENLIQELSKNHSIVLFGQLQRRTNPYSHLPIKVISQNRTKLFRVIQASGLIINSLIKRIPILQIMKTQNKRCTNIPEVFSRLYIVLSVLNERLDILHFQWAKSVVLYPEIIHYKNCPIVLSLRGTHINISPLVTPELAIAYKNIFPLVDGFHAVSDSLSEKGIQYGATPKSIQIIYPAVHDRIINRFPGKVKMVSNPVQIISVGRCHWVKGYTFALDALYQLHQQNIHYHYTIVASGTDRENILFQIDDLGISEKVTFINGAPYERVLKKIQEADILLQSSYSEGIANTVLEAMALGTLVISADTGGMDEVICSGENGFLFKVHDLNSLVNCISNAINMSNVQYEEIIKAAFEKISSRHRLSKQGIAIEELYNQLILDGVK